MIDTGPSWMYSRADFLFPDILGVSAMSILVIGTQLMELDNKTNTSTLCHAHTVGHAHYLTETGKSKGINLS